MAKQEHQSAHGKEFMETLSPDPTKPHGKSSIFDDVENQQGRAADFPARSADDMGQLYEEQSEGYPFSEKLSEAVGPQGENAEQNGGSGPRIDDLGFGDLQDRDELEKKDLPMMDALARTDMPVFDQSIDNEDPDQPPASKRSKKADDTAGVGEDPLSDEDLRPYDVSLDGPGTSDLH